MKEQTPNLSAITDKYLVRRQGEGYSPQTLSTYGLHLRMLREDLGDVPMPGISLEQLRAHLESFPHLKFSSLGTKVRALRAFWKWAHEEGFIDVNQMMRIKEPKLPQRVPKHLNVEQLELLRDSCRSEFEHALIELFYATAARIGETHGMDRAQIDWQQSSIVVFGKGSKEREVYFGAKAGIWLKRYLDTRGDDDPALFVTRYLQHGKHQRMSIDRLRFYVKRVAERCGLREKVTPHVLRHTLATHLIYVPDDLVVDTEIIVFSLSRISRHRFPLDIGVLGPKLLGDLLGGLANDFEAADESPPQCFVCHEGLERQVRSGS